MSNPNQLPPQIPPREQYAEEMGGLPTAAVEAQQQMLGNTLGEMDFDPENPAHTDVRDRFLGAAAVLRDRMDDEPASSKSEADPDDPQSGARYALRVDGGVDVVTAEGAKSIDRNEEPPAGGVLASYQPTTPSIGPAKKTARLSYQPTVQPTNQQSGRRVILR